jgi:nucleoside-diphosphate-sugar epimerase
MSNKHLIIGNTSQLSYYFPSNYDSISSRNIDFESIKDIGYDRIFLLFAEQRTFLNENQQFFNEINVDYTVEVIDELKDHCNKIVIFSTSELWNNHSGAVDVEMNYDYNFTPYIRSKEILCDIINADRDKYDNIIIIYPFNFNTPHRKEGFLFNKIFKSIINNEEISVGDLNMNRDIIHPKTIVENAIYTDVDILIGSGELIKIETFIKDLFDSSKLKYDDLVKVNISNNLSNVRKEYFSKIKYSNYDELLELTNKDIINYE